MPQAQRSSDVVEIHAEHAIMAGIGGLIGVALGGVMIRYQGMLIGLGWTLLILGVASISYAIYCALQVRKVTSFDYECPYCHAHNKLLEPATGDFSCVACHRLIPFADGAIVKVFQVRCGFCHELNWYSEKSHGLICENCDREIPIATADNAVRAQSFHAYSRHDDDKLYDLVLIASGHKTEQLIACLQSMLALNRNQVKDILGNLPQTLLTGIPRKKAEMLVGQLAVHDGAAEFIEHQQVAS